MRRGADWGNSSGALVPVFKALYLSPEGRGLWPGWVGSVSMLQTFHWRWPGLLESFPPSSGLFSLPGPSLVPVLSSMALCVVSSSLALVMATGSSSVWEHFGFVLSVTCFNIITLLFFNWPVCNGCSCDSPKFEGQLHSPHAFMTTSERTLLAPWATNLQLGVSHIPM